MPRRAFDFELDARICVGCLELTRIVGRNLCRPCYHRLWTKKHSTQTKASLRKYKRSAKGKKTIRAYLQRPSVKIKSAARFRKWRANNRAYFVETNRRRRAQKYQTPILERISSQQWEALKQRYNYQCAWCEQVFDAALITQDHIIPLSKGGAHTLQNIVPSCRPCNSHKRAIGPPNWPMK